MQTLRIDNEFRGLIPPLQPDEYSGLEKSICEEGCRDAIVVWGDIIIDGHNRYDICEKYDRPFQTVELEFDNRDDVKLWIITNQFSRRNLSAYDRSVLALRMKDIIAARAKERMLSGKKADPSQKSAQGRSHEELGEIADVSRDTIAKVAKIEAVADEKTKQKIRAGKLSINKVHKDIIQIERREERKKNMVEKKLPRDDYELIYCDPPWRYEFSETQSRDVENQYPTMELDEIKGMKVPAAKDCVLLMWTTAPKLTEAIQTIDAWGFNYKTCAIWDKEIIGMGYWFRSQHELLLLAIKGTPRTPDPENRFSSVYKEKRGKHSVKPEFYYNMIKKMFPELKKIELFSRKDVDGFNNWGNEQI